MRKNLILMLLMTLTCISLCGCSNDALKSVLVEVEKYADGGVGYDCKYVDKSGNTKLEPYKLGYFAFVNDDGMCSEFSEGLLLVAIPEGRWVYIDKNGEIKIKTDFNGWGNDHDAPLGEFKNGIAEVYLNDEFQGYINKSGKFIKKDSEKGK